MRDKTGKPKQQSTNRFNHKKKKKENSIFNGFFLLFCLTHYGRGGFSRAASFLLPFLFFCLCFCFVYCLLCENASVIIGLLGCAGNCEFGNARWNHGGFFMNKSVQFSVYLELRGDRLCYVMGSVGWMAELYGSCWGFFLGFYYLFVWIELNIEMYCCKTPRAWDW